jgi:hypothetical protein
VQWSRMPLMPGRFSSHILSDSRRVKVGRHHGDMVGSASRSLECLFFVRWFVRRPTLNHCSGIGYGGTARHVKTVNTQPRGKTVGACKHRYRLRWSPGDRSSERE